MADYLRRKLKIPKNKAKQNPKNPNPTTTTKQNQKSNKKPPKPFTKPQTKKVLRKLLDQKNPKILNNFKRLSGITYYRFEKLD